MYFNYKQLFKEKYDDIMQNEPDYLQSLILKKKLLHIHFNSCLLFILLHIAVCFLMRFYFMEYRTIKFIFIFINYSDLILVLIMTIVHYPRKLPPYYIEEDRDPLENINNNNLEENNFFKNIYSYAFNEKNEEEYFKNYKKDESPNLVIIENPFNESKLEETNIDDEEDEEEEKEDNGKNIKGEEDQILIDKNNNGDKVNIINVPDKDILDLSHTKLGFIY